MLVTLTIIIQCKSLDYSHSPIITNTRITRNLHYSPILATSFQIPLDLHCGVFVTLNPAGEDYGGRQKLPGNIQDLFRPIVMQQPEPKEVRNCLIILPNQYLNPPRSLSNPSIHSTDLQGDALRRGL